MRLLIEIPDCDPLDYTEEQYMLVERALSLTEECDSCADYISNKITLGEEPTEENLSMWIIDHFTGPE